VPLNIQKDTKIFYIGQLNSLLGTKPNLHEERRQS